jgi:hypothetical protein
MTDEERERQEREALRLDRKLEIERLIQDAVAAAREASKPRGGEPLGDTTALTSRELALTLTKLEEAEMWAARIPA